MRTEAITWRELPADGMPDADITVLALIRGTDGTDEAWPAWWSGEHWIEAGLGDRMERSGVRVIAWTDMLNGGQA